MKKFVVTASAAVLALGMAAPAMSAPIFAPVPTANYITFGGLDWAWAAPCAPQAPSCGVIDMSYQSTQGWRVATAADFASGITAADFGPSASNFKCASAWFSTIHTHCDYNDGVQKAVFNHPNNPFPGNANVDTWVVRGNVGVPEPATWGMMLLGFGLAGTAMRRRTKVSVSFA